MCTTPETETKAAKEEYDQLSSYEVVSQDCGPAEERQVMQYEDYETFFVQKEDSHKKGERLSRCIRRRLRNGGIVRRNSPFSQIDKGLGSILSICTSYFS